MDDAIVKKIYVLFRSRGIRAHICLPLCWAAAFRSKLVQNHLIISIIKLRFVFLLFCLRKTRANNCISVLPCLLARYSLIGIRVAVARLVVLDAARLPLNLPPGEVATPHRRLAPPTPPPPRLSLLRSDWELLDLETIRNRKKTSLGGPDLTQLADRATEERVTR
jgi:hypothetical protein